MRCQGLYKNSHKSENKGEDSGTDESDDETYNTNQPTPVLKTKMISHIGSVNRLRSFKEGSFLKVASWSDQGKVHIYDISEHYASLENTSSQSDVGYKKIKSKSNAYHQHTNLKDAPIYTVKNHSCEGYALDWSKTGKLLSGDMKGKIYLTTLKQNNIFLTDENAFIGHTDSVEDVQWSSQGEDIFASASIDQSVKIWDLRDQKKSPKLSAKVATSDVNVISWNKYA